MLAAPKGVKLTPLPKGYTLDWAYPRNPKYSHTLITDGVSHPTLVYGTSHVRLGLKSDQQLKVQIVHVDTKGAASPPHAIDIEVDDVVWIKEKVPEGVPAVFYIAEEDTNGTIHRVNPAKIDQTDDFFGIVGKTGIANIGGLCASEEDTEALYAVQRSGHIYRVYPLESDGEGNLRVEEVDFHYAREGLDGRSKQGCVLVDGTMYAVHPAYMESILRFESISPAAGYTSSFYHLGVRQVSSLGHIAADDRFVAVAVGSFGQDDDHPNGTVFSFALGDAGAITEVKQHGLIPSEVIDVDQEDGIRGLTTLSGALYGVERSEGKIVKIDLADATDSKVVGTPADISKASGMVAVVVKTAKPSSS